ncbi:hypothetical protein AB0M47_11770 [Hamadaea sp. NPDC051192]|uniref:hypothetical protein n=1 Tax=Hamadaea sp. NPDC051192 TaxID=3154940 RepID=UPI00343A7EC6
MSLWGTLTAEQRAVMITAAEEASLVNVMDEWRARQRWAETGSTRTPSDLTDADKDRLIERFAAVVLDLVNIGWIAVEEHSTPLTDAELSAALDDSKSWISALDGEHRMVMLITTDAWDEASRAVHGPQVSPMPQL